MREMLNKLSELGGSLPHQPWPYWAAMGSVALGLILLVSSFISMSYDLTATFKDSNEVVAAAASRQAPLVISDANTNLSRAELFGENPAGQASRLTLMGIGASEDKNAASAIISIDGGPADTYSIGDNPIPGTAIVSISADTVILLHDGVRQKLTLDWGRLVNNPNTDFAGDAPAPTGNAAPGMSMDYFKNQFAKPGGNQ